MFPINFLKSEFKKNFLKNSLIFLLMTVSVLVTTTVFFLVSQSTASISKMYQIAQPPHFLQMHQGEIDQEKIDQFNQSYKGVVAWQTIELLNVNGEQLTVHHQNGMYSLANSQLDMSLVKQNQKYDLLLNSKHIKIKLKSGEIAVPKILLDEFSMKIGDTITVKEGNSEKNLKIVDYVYDAQMNSTLISSTRFLISNQDFEELSQHISQKEYIIETYFTNVAEVDAYQTAYKNKNLPQNGPSITYHVMFFLSALTDLAIAAIYILIGSLLLLVTLICLRFILFAELESESKEIGILKAIGVPNQSIKDIYLQRISFLALFAGLVGYFLTLTLFPLTSKHIQETFGGTQAISISRNIIGLLVAAFVPIIIILFSNQLLRVTKKATVTQLLVSESGFSKRKKLRHYRPIEKRSANFLVSRREVRKGYFFIFWLSLLVSFCLVWPYRLLSTMNNREFVTYMGSPLHDISITVEEGNEGNNVNQSAEVVQKQLEKDKLTYSTIRRIQIQAKSKGDEAVSFSLDTGNTAGKGLHYLKGKAAKNNNEIALSALAAKELQKSIGDSLSLFVNNEEVGQFKIAGIYQDITNGGKTAKVTSKISKASVQKYLFYVYLHDKSKEKQTIKELKKDLKIGGYTIVDSSEFIQQTLGGMIKQMQETFFYAFCICLTITSCILFLFLKLRLTQNVKGLAIKQILGVSFKDIYLQELYPLCFMGILGISIGMILAQYLGESLTSMLLSTMNSGIKQLHFISIEAFELTFPLVIGGILISFILFWAIRPRPNSNRKIVLQELNND